MKRFFLLFTFLFSASLFGQNNFQQFVIRVNGIPNPNDKQTVIDSFMTANAATGFPVIEGEHAIFIYEGDASSMKIAGDFTGWSPTVTMNRLPATNFFYYYQIFEMNARLDYKMIRNGSEWILDPLNEHKCAGGFGNNSELAMPEYVRPWEIITYPNVLSGTHKDTTFTSTVMNASYQMRIYVPYGYDPADWRTYPTVYFQDGFDYLSLAKAETVLNNIIDAKQIEPVIAVFVKPRDRNTEYADSLRFKYQQFFAEELVPFIDSRYKTRPAKEERLVLGDSFGGNISALISYNYPEVFGKCGLHSGAFWPNDYEAYNVITGGEKKDIEFFSVWGTYEGSLPQNMRDFRDNLTGLGYRFGWLEFPEGHSWGLWKANIDTMLAFFFPYDPNGIEEADIAGAFELLQNYPNPFNPSTTIEYSIPEASYVRLAVYDILGREIIRLVDTRQHAGMYRVRFDGSALPSGTYFSSLSVNESRYVKKMILLK